MKRPRIEDDPDLWRALRGAIEAERLFGLDFLPRGPALAPVAPEEETPPTMAVPASIPSMGPSGGVDLDTLAQRIASCRACRLCETRSRTVPGQGAPRARLMLIGEAPGHEEDRQGLAFVGASGQLLTRMLAAIGLDREEVFIANILKCRPPENREPAPSEVESCIHFLFDQIDLVQPEVICTLGGTAANNLLERSESMSRLRGRVFDLRGRKLVPTYHPSYLLRRPEEKRKAWEDLQLVASLLGLSLPPRGGG